MAELGLDVQLGKNWYLLPADRSVLAQFLIRSGCLLRRLNFFNILVEVFAVGKLVALDFCWICDRSRVYALALAARHKTILNVGTYLRIDLRLFFNGRVCLDFENPS